MVLLLLYHGLVKEGVLGGGQRTKTKKWQENELVMDAWGWGSDRESGIKEEWERWRERAIVPAGVGYAPG